MSNPLLSLSLAAASLPPAETDTSTINSLSSLSEIAASLPRQPTAPQPAPKTRRLSSAGQARRRLSDATAATVTQAVVSRASVTGTNTSTAVLPPSSFPSATVSAALIKSPPQESSVQPLSLDSDTNYNTTLHQHIPKKKGQIYKCESCSKLYRHPSCLVKHRWEHSPHWREASKFLLSKHQQVQLLEAAAILTHIVPPSDNSVEPELSSSCGTSLPEDRSLWPFYVSGGALPPPSTLSSSLPASANQAFGTIGRSGHARSISSASSAVDKEEEEEEDVDVDGEDDGGEDEEDDDTDARDSGYFSSTSSPATRPVHTTSYKDEGEEGESVGVKTRSRSRSSASATSRPYNLRHSHQVDTPLSHHRKVKETKQAILKKETSIFDDPMQGIAWRSSSSLPASAAFSSAPWSTTLNKHRQSHSRSSSVSASVAPTRFRASPSPSSFAVIDGEGRYPSLPTITSALTVPEPIASIRGISVPRSNIRTAHPRYAQYDELEEKDEDVKGGETEDDGEDEETVDGSEEWDAHAGMVMDMDL